jgi:hypothetical protein
VEGVRHKIAPRVASPTEIDENFPVTRARPEKVHLFTRTKVFQKIEGLSQWCRFLENLRMCDHAQAATQGEFRYGDSSGIVKGCFQPRLDFTVLIGVRTMRATKTLTSGESLRFHRIQERRRRAEIDPG